MWIMCNDGFISAVEDWNDPTGNSLVVRGRRRIDIESFFDRDRVVVLGGSDYKYRVFTTKNELAQIISNRIRNIDYTNFKNSVDNCDRKKFYNQVWLSGLNYQESEH